MSDPAIELPAELQEELEKALSSVFDQAWDLVASGYSMPTSVETAVSSRALQAVAAAARRKYTAVAQAARLQNERASWMNRLPNELWWHILECLPFPDRFAATRVCARWRECLRALPHLWTNLHFYACNAMVGSGSQLILSDILELSSGRPLDVSVDGNLVSRRSCGALSFLGHQLSRHAPRIVRLRVRSLHTDDPYHFFCAFSTLPALRYLVVERIAPVQGEQSLGYVTYPFCPYEVKLPMLEYARLGRGFTWMEDEHIQSMRILDLTPVEDADEELRAALACCPQLTTLRLDLCANDNAFSTDHPRAKLDLPSTLRSIMAVSLRCATEAFLRPFTSDRTLAELVLEYECPCCDGPTSELYFFAHLICGNPDEVVDIRLDYDERRLSIRATGVSGRIRSVVFNSCNDPSPLLKVFAVVLAFAECKVKVNVDASLQNYVSVLRSPVCPHPHLVEIELPLED